MHTTRTFIAIGLSAFLVGACGGGGGGGGDPGPGPAPPSSESYSVTLIAIDADRSADQEDLNVDGLPESGATVTVE